MKRLIIDFYNQYAKFSFNPRVQKSLFFRSVCALRDRYNCGEVYYVFDGSDYYKKKINPNYKKNRNRVIEYSSICKVQEIIHNLDKSFVVKSEELEADDMSYHLCKEYDHSICVSEDRDWLINLVANDNIYVYQDGKMLHKYNFINEKGFPIEKIPLFLFLSGDSKDGVRKPFRLRGNPLQNTVKYESIKDYCIKNEIKDSEIEQYVSLISPVRHIPFNVYVGHKTDRTPVLLKENKIDFMSRSKKQKEMLRECIGN
jgi:hypothetical protein